MLNSTSAAKKIPRIHKDDLGAKGGDIVWGFLTGLEGGEKRR